MQQVISHQQVISRSSAGHQSSAGPSPGHALLTVLPTPAAAMPRVLLECCPSITLMPGWPLATEEPSCGLSTAGEDSRLGTIVTIPAIPATPTAPTTLTTPAIPAIPAMRQLHVGLHTGVRSIRRHSTAKPDLHLRQRPTWWLRVRTRLLSIVSIVGIIVQPRLLSIVSVISTSAWLVSQCSTILTMLTC